MSEAKVIDFLKEGCIIKTKHCENPSWVTNIVYSINNYCIEIDVGLERNYIESLIMIGDTVKCKFAEKNVEYFCTGCVTKIQADFPQRISIRIDEIKKYKNQRENIRSDIYLCSVVKQDKEDNKGIFAIITNISVDSIAFIVHDELEQILNMPDLVQKNAKLYFAIYTSPNKQLSFGAEIKRKALNEKGVEYGVDICEIDSENQQLLNDFIKDSKEKDKAFYNKRNDFCKKNTKLNKT